jgi:hypothetical protein
MSQIEIDSERVSLPGELTVPSDAAGIAVFAHGSGSSRLSPRNVAVARALNERGIATLLFDLLTSAEADDRGNVFDIDLLSDRPFHGFWLHTFKQIPIRRGTGDSGALDEAVATVREGAITGIFPEGTVNPDPSGPMLRGRTGLARIALAASAPVIPVAIWGTQARWPRTGLTFRRPFRPAVALAFGRPIEPDGDSSSLDDIQAFTELIMGTIAEEIAVARDLVERPRPGPA